MMQVEVAAAGVVAAAAVTRSLDCPIPKWTWTLGGEWVVREQD
jgi:hypothetical protein